MKYLFIAIITLSFYSNSFSQNREQLNILNQFITAHNIGTESSIKKFISASYLPEVYKKLDLGAHIAFYKQIVDEFGPLNSKIYYKVEETQHMLIVHLIKKGERITNLMIKPEDILQIKIDLSKTNPKYMSRGLGLGSLLCEQKRE